MQWKEIDKTISKTFEFNSYLDGIDFVNEIANLAEEEIIIQILSLDIVK